MENGKTEEKWREEGVAEVTKMTKQRDSWYSRIYVKVVWKKFRKIEEFTTYIIMNIYSAIKLFDKYDDSQRILKNAHWTIFVTSKKTQKEWGR